MLRENFIFTTIANIDFCFFTFREKETKNKNLKKNRLNAHYRQLAQTTTQQVSYDALLKSIGNPVPKAPLTINSHQIVIPERNEQMQSVNDCHLRAIIEILVQTLSSPK